ncbi:hypothetical protein B0H14DRAFT_511811 [Mycena olivaceomarginata]|nr:hypothetical protein B0H14DRAFT_511811 [Mycena olivaceomarginata]
MPLNLGSIYHFPRTGNEPRLEIAFSPYLDVVDGGWETEHPIVDDYWTLMRSGEGTSILENGWIRVNSACVAEQYRRRVSCDADVCFEGWLTQSGHIFNTLDIKSNLEDYLQVYAIDCYLQLLGPIKNLPPGYLFLCPLTDFETEVSRSFRIPDCPAYWSRDPIGAELNPEEARNLGFPDLAWRMECGGAFWDNSTYTGIRQFDEGKGFDPNTQEVAVQLGYPLFQVSCERQDPVACRKSNSPTLIHLTVKQCGKLIPTMIILDLKECLVAKIVNQLATMLRMRLICTMVPTSTSKWSMAYPLSRKWRW